jgi:hypothetical protein
MADCRFRKPGLLDATSAFYREVYENHKQRATHEQREPSYCEGGALENSRKTATLGTVVFLKRGYIGNKIRETKQ